MKEFSVGPINVKYCEKCFDSELDYDPNLVFHMIRTEYLDRHPNFVLRPENKGEHEHGAPHYHRYLHKDFIHLCPLEISDINLNDNDVHFCFEIDELKQRYPNMIFMDCDVWDILGFFDVEENEKKHFKKRLFVSDYSIEPPTEVLLEELDLRLVSFCLVYNGADELLIKELKKATDNDFPIYDAGELKNIVDKYYRLLVLECDHITS